jgi:hypothetical protein
MIAENVNTHAHVDVHLVVLAHLQRRWSLSGRARQDSTNSRKRNAHFSLTGHWPRGDQMHPGTSGQFRQRCTRAEWPDARTCCDRTRRACAGRLWRMVTSALSSSMAWPNAAVCQVKGDQTRPIMIYVYWLLSVLDRTPCCGASGQYAEYPFVFITALSFEGGL